MKHHYLIQIPPRKSGIYLILNLLEKKAYVGLAKNFYNRTLDHFKAICNTHDGENTTKSDKEVNENNNLLKERNRNFLHIPIYSNVNTNYDLQDIETAFMSIIKESGFTLYNYAKSQYSFPEKLLPIKDELCSSLNQSLHELQLDNIDALAKLKEPTATWNTLVIRFGQEEGRFVLTKDEGQLYYYDKNYETVWRRLRNFNISKEKLALLGIDWEEKSILKFPEKSRDLIVISNYGSHNGEAPYDILQKKAADIKEYDYCYWALKKLNENNFQNLINSKLATDSNPQSSIYVLFKTTPSDNSTNNELKPNLESYKTEEQLRNEYEKRILDNDLDIKNFYYNPTDNNWLHLSSLYPITSPWSKKPFESKSVAFKIKNFFVCKEYFDVNKDIKAMDKESCIHPFIGKQEDGTYNLGELPVYTGEIHPENLKVSNCSDETQVLFAELEYPYLVIIAHIPTFDIFLTGNNFQRKETPRVIIETRCKPTGVKTIIDRIIVVYKKDGINKSWVYEEKGLTIGSITSSDKFKLEENPIIDTVIKNGDEGTYEISYSHDRKAELTIHCKNNNIIHYAFNKDYDPIKEKSYLYAKARDKEGYYCFPTDNGKFIGFRAFNEKCISEIIKPLFFFDK